MPILSGVRNLTKSIVGDLFSHLLWILSRQKINIKTWALHNITDLIFEILKTLGSIIGGQQRNNGMDSPVLKVRKSWGIHQANQMRILQISTVSPNYESFSGLQKIRFLE